MHIVVHVVAEVNFIKMLFPPGIRNSGNISFATSILQCLLNQRMQLLFLLNATLLSVSTVATMFKCVVVIVFVDKYSGCGDREEMH